ncbi:DUF5787 family protein [Halosegnis marinus]|uniref:DUF5787 family protein n=1 Tax=Halosegnis marinus TaxID=3034023 RepID=A0ABD5ZQJ6_9EURY|nr:DUF5787 family protein [Halosegnis sp. DT85]
MEPEFLFELRVCRWAERAWTPADPDDAVLVARQLGVRSRRWDTLILECDPDGLDARAVFGDERLDSDLLHVVRNAPGSYAYYRDALPDPGYGWRYVREAIHEAADRGLVETRRNGNRIELRRKYRYPDWVNRVVAVENKPDLSASAARALGDQLERDVALGLADEVWVATRATGDDVAPALYERLPVEAGILAVGDGVETAWNATALAVAEPGTRILDRPSGGEHDRSAARFEYVSPEWKADKRREIAERAYERGWRSFLDTMRPDCRSFEVRDPDTPLPYCTAKGRHVTAAECKGSCPEFAPEPPAWRSKGWPVDGGPGKALRRVLERQRARRR